MLILRLQAEINYLGQLYHPNLVKLIGYCLEDDHRLLVYEFMPKGSLENHLFRSELLISSDIDLSTQVVVFSMTSNILDKNH